MPDASTNRVFISCVSDEFEKPEAPFPGFRSQLRHYLSRADCEVKVQEEFRQRGDVDTVEKLADYIRSCAAVIHLVGEIPGGAANRKAVADYLAAEPQFLQNYPDLRAALGDFADLTYTQWEALLALHYGIPLFVYATDRAATQQTHLDRLRLARKFASPIKNHSDLLGQLIGDIHSIIASVPRFTRKIAPSRNPAACADRPVRPREVARRPGCGVGQGELERVHAGGLGRRGQDVAGGALGQHAPGSQGLAGRGTLLRLVVLQPGHRRIAADLVGPVHSASAELLRRP
jgi:hypothetical protein